MQIRKVHTQGGLTNISVDFTICITDKTPMVSRRQILLEPKPMCFVYIVLFFIPGLGDQWGCVPSKHRTALERELGSHLLQVCSHIFVE